jgi:chaperone BCS1
MMLWLSTMPEWHNFRGFTVSTSNFGFDHNSLELEEDDDEDPDNTREPELRKRARKVRYLPAYATSYRFWYKGRLVWISREKEESRWYSDKSSLYVTCVCSLPYCLSHY